MLPLQFPDPDITALSDSIPTRAEEMSVLSNLTFDELVQKVVHSLVTFAINLAIAIVVFYVGRYAIRKIYNFLSTVFVKRSLDRSLTSFVLSMVKIVLYFILIVTVIGILGIETSSFIALFASAGVAVGMALSGTLQNFAGGVLILLLKPYKIGDYIEAQGYAGTVREIQIFHTVITTGDNKSIIIPNGGLSTGSVNNWSREDYRRVEWPVSISYGDSVEAARNKLLEILNTDPDVVKTTFAADRLARKQQAEVKDEESEVSKAQPGAEPAEEVRKPGFFARLFHPRRSREIMQAAGTPEVLLPYKQAAEVADRAPVVLLGELADSSVNLKVRAWTRSTLYWDVYFRINERIYAELPTAGISFPFPQLDVHMPDNNQKQS
ncbi:MAG: mechanosensitive ion channel [Bacteroidales bacterium]|nr:mechanosensitive ion channel [Bacteroidales bacterium]